MKQFIIYLLSFFSLLNAQNSVSGSFSPVEEYSFAFLYQATPSGPTFIDRARLDENGSFSIAIDSTQAPGMYKIVYAIPPDDNNFDFIYSGNESVAFTFDKEDGIVFTESNENKLWASYIKSMGMINQTISNYYQQDGTDVEAFTEIFNTLNDTQIAYEDSAKDLLVKTLIEANQPYVPNSYQDLSTYTGNLKSNFFNHIDFDNELLQSSNFIRDRINSYMFSISEDPTLEENKQRIDEIASAISDSKSTTQLGIHQLLWDEFVQLNMEEEATYIASAYLLDLAERTNNMELVTKIKAEQRIAIGQTAPDFIIKNDTLETTLNALTGGDQYLLIFWSSGCSHCLKEVPQVHALLEDNKNVQVVAYALEDGVTSWKNTIAPLGNFIHVYGPKKWDNPIVELYNLKATPSYFLLNADKTIIAKPYDYKALEALITAQ